MTEGSLFFLEELVALGDSLKLQFKVDDEIDRQEREEDEQEAATRKSEEEREQRLLKNEPERDPSLLLLKDDEDGVQQQQEEEACEGEKDNSKAMPPSRPLIALVRAYASNKVPD